VYILSPFDTIITFQTLLQDHLKRKNLKRFFNHITEDSRFEGIAVKSAIHVLTL